MTRLLFPLSKLARMSEQAELERYEYQLTQTRQQLSEDPDNEDLKTLQTELEGLVDMLKEATKPSASVPVAAHKQPQQNAPTHNLKAGEDCMAKYSDGKWYAAKILSVSGAGDKRAYSIKYAEYDSTEVVSYNEVRPLSASKKRQLELEEAEREKERKRKKNEKKTETQAIKAKVQAESQKNWQSFAKKSTKKGVHIPGVKGLSLSCLLVARLTSVKQARASLNLPKT